MTDHDTIAALAAEMRADSEAWFPWLHDKQTATVPLTVAYTLGLAGEAGEVANLVKKANRDGWDTIGDRLAAELADVFVYLLVLAGEQGIDIVQAYRDKRRENVLRFAGEELSGVPVGGGEPQPTTRTDNDAEDEPHYEPPCCCSHVWDEHDIRSSTCEVPGCFCIYYEADESVRSAGGGDQPDTPCSPTGEWAVTVTVPDRVFANDADRVALCSAIADAAYDWQPEDRDGWDIDVTAAPVVGEAHGA